MTDSTHIIQQGIKEIFYDAIDVPDEERDAFVRARALDNEVVVARVQALLAAHVDAGEFMEEPTAGALIEASRPEDEHPSAIGPYRIDRMLGEGGYGTVYLAHQDSPVRREVAIKVIKPGMDSRQVVLRFEVERQTLAMMDHPSIARVLDAGTTPEGRPFFVMERVEGEPITQYCDRRRLSIRNRLRLFEQVCHAVQHAHQKGVIHRDLKPTNVLVTEVDGRPVPKIIDFGIAKALCPERPEEAITETLQVIGTPQYMSPEQATAGGCVDTRSDVYSLSVLLYELLAGVPPFEGERLRSASFGELERIIREEIPPRPSARLNALAADRTRVAGQRRAEPERLIRQLKGELDWIVMRAMEKDPARRYPTAYAIATDIGRYLRNEPVEAGPPSRTYRVLKFASRHRYAIGAAVVTMLVFTGLLVGSVAFGVKAERARRDAEAQVVRGNELTDFAQSIITGVDPAVARTEDTTLLRRLLDDAAHRVHDELGDQPEAAVSMLNAIGFAYRQIAEYDLAMEIFEESARRGRTEIGEDDLLTLDAEQNVAAMHIARSEYDEAERLLLPLLRRRTRVSGPNDEVTIETQSNLAYLYKETGRYEQAHSLWEDVLERRRRVLGEDDDATIATMNSLAATTSALGDEDGALKLLHQVLAHQLDVDGEDNPRTLATMNNIADSLLTLGRYDEGAATLERVIDVKRTVLPAHHPSIVISMNNLAHAHMRRGDYETAAQIMHEAVEMARVGAGDPHMITLTARSTLATAERKLGHLESAESLLLRSIEDIRELSPNHPNEAVLLANLARVLLDLGRIEEALDRSAHAEQIALSLFPSPTARRLGVDIVRAHILFAAGDEEAGESRLIEVHEFAEGAFGPTHPRTIEAAKTLADAYESVGRDDEAAAWREKLPEDQR